MILVQMRHTIKTFVHHFKARRYATPKMDMYTKKCKVGGGCVVQVSKASSTRGVDHQNCQQH